MNALKELLHEGGWVMYAIILLSIVLYSQCFQLFFWLATERARARRINRAGPVDPRMARERYLALQAWLNRKKVLLGTLITAAPLMGLLGTVEGMTRTFASLGEGTGQTSMEGFAQGISQVLVATESGLAVAIPALLLLGFAHRSIKRDLAHATQSSAETLRAPSP